MADSVVTTAITLKQERWERIQVKDRVVMVSDLGGVCDARGVRMTVTVRPDGYRSVGWWNGQTGKQTRVYVHRLVAQAFLGDPPEGHEARHLRGVSAGDCLENLAWGTSSANKRDTILAGLVGRGEAHHLSKFTEPTVLALRALKPFLPVRILAEWLEVSEGAISKVQLGYRWQHVQGMMTTEEALVHLFGRSKTFCVNALPGRGPSRQRKTAPAS